MTIGPRPGGASTASALEGFTRIRETAEAYTNKRDLAGDGWSEEAVTAIAVTEGRPYVDVVEFNRNQEGGGLNALGADYLWWWLDSHTGECFGMLVQAKRLKLGPKGWLVDISHRDGKQLGDLLRTARALEVPAVYAVYMGGLVFRETLACFHEDQITPPSRSASRPSSKGDCLPCRKMAISMVTAYQLNTGWHDPKKTADLVVSESVPVEDLVDPDIPSPPVWDCNLKDLTDPQLREFLLKPQGGSREVARRIFRLVSQHRSGAFSAASAEPLPVPGAPIFPSVPEDAGHFPGPYYRHVLQGLRTSPPDYVETLRRPPTPDEFLQLPGGSIGRMAAGAAGAAGRRPPPELQDANIAGVVLITL